MTAGKMVLVSLMALGLSASTAHAEPLTMTFTEGRADVGVQLNVVDDVLFEAPATAPLTAQIDPATGAIADGAIAVPPFSTFIDDPIESDVLVDFDIGVVEGSFDQATGALTLSGTAGGTLTADGGECTVSTVPAVLTLSTSGSTGETTNSRSGAPFAAGLAGSGAIAGQWTDMIATEIAAEDEDFCESVTQEIDGPGGVWLQHDGDVVAPAAPQLTGTDPASPNASGTPRIRGAAEAGSTVRVYAGTSCAGTPVAAGSAAELAAPGIQVSVAEGATATFSATATDPFGNASTCSAAISYTRPKPPTPPVVTPVCIVPKLVGKTLKQAKKALKNADCKLGKVTKPKQPKGKKAKGKKRVLVVKRSFPGRGAKPADGKVDLKLRAKPKQAAKPKKGSKPKKQRR